MRTIRGTVLAAAAAALLFWAPAPTVAKKPREITASAQSQFGLDMYKVMTDGDKTNNVLFSPLSICTALAMTFAGSRGDTTRQMADVLHFNERRPVIMRGHRGLLRRLKRRYGNDVTFKMTNRLYLARRLKMRNRFSKLMERVFGASIAQMPFNRPKLASRMINRNVFEDTAGAIEELIQPQMLSSLTRLVLVNAVYFKGEWLSKFDREDTRPGTFHAPTGQRPVDMMRHREPFAFGRVPELRSRVLLLPYQGNKLHMMIILPNRRDGIQTLQRGLSKMTLSEVYKKAEVGRAIEVKMPRFKLNERINLKVVLEMMGMKDLFDPERADLSRIGRGQLYATDAVHKAVIEVNEEGSEASAATGITIGFRKVGPKPPPFVVDRPFFFAIYDAVSDLTLFLGRVMDPTA